MTKIKYIEENDVEDMELFFEEEEYKDGKLERVICDIDVFAICKT